MNMAKLRLLVVDDDNDILTLAEKLLKSQYDVVTANSGKLALEILNSVEVHGLICDINMPEMNGFQLLKRINDLEHLSHLTIAMLTGVRERKDIEKAINMGVNDYIIKPIDPMLFLKKIDNLFHSKQGLQTDIQFVKVHMQSPAHLKNKIEIRTVSEMGISLESSTEQKVGDIIELDFDLFDQLSIRAPHLKVLSCKANDRNKWIIHLGFVGASEAIRQKLRAWIYKKTAQKKVKAS